MFGFESEHKCGKTKESARQRLVDRRKNAYLARSLASF